MPNYFFNFDGEKDAEGTQLPDDAAARATAMHTFGTMIKEGSIASASTVEVFDASGRRVVTLRFSAEG
jgi:hypothetical protein